jgi:hypothetical protein
MNPRPPTPKKSLFELPASKIASEERDSKNTQFIYTFTKASLKHVNEPHQEGFS